jgi:hypothetical protein
MFCLELGGRALVGSSPEIHVRCEDGRVEVRPIAGTRPRAEDPARTARLAEELLADPKERAEHIMLVDLARNDIGRVCEYGTVRVPELMVIERYSHVMHIVSDVVGRLAPGRDAYDVMRATFPAGTVSGAPKIRAMEIIAELEAARRGPYAGAVGYFGFDGNLDSCITIRTVLLDGAAYVQAGAGIVADSVPATANTRRRATRRAACSRRWRCRAGLRARGAEDGMILVIDNYDSFTYNLVQYLGELGAEVKWCATTRSPSSRSRRCAGAIVVSPGPCSPNEAGCRATSSARSAPAPAGVRRVPGPPVHRPGVRRARGARGPADARQDLADPARRHEACFRGHAEPFRGDPLPLPAGRARLLPDCLDRRSPPRPPRARSWACAPDPAGVRRPVPPRIDPMINRLGEPETPSPGRQ